ncbi:hypothetical protein Tco_1184325 [Tanacetum coccineum]
MSSIKKLIGVKFLVGVKFEEQNVVYKEVDPAGADAPMHYGEINPLRDLKKLQLRIFVLHIQDEVMLCCIFTYLCLGSSPVSQEGAYLEGKRNKVEERGRELTKEAISWLIKLIAQYSNSKV